MTGPDAARDLRALPKVHVHVHLDGCYPRPAVEALAASKGRPFAVPDSYPDVWAFFDAYGTVPPLVDSLDELAGLCRALVLAEAADTVLFLEPAIEPQLYSPRLGTIASVTAAMVDALQAAGAEAGIQVGANLTINTDQDLEIAGELSAAAVAWAGRGVTALGTAGFIEPAGLERFVPAARAAQDAGLQIVSHAGQVGGPESVLEAIDVLGATRISHGVHAVRSPELLARMAEESIVCDVCPVSNVALGVAPSLAEHPGPAMIAAGVPVTLNADDSLWFGASATDQYAVAREVWGLDDERLASIARDGLLLPALSAETRSAFEATLSAWFVPKPDRPGV